MKKLLLGIGILWSGLLNAQTTSILADNQSGFGANFGIINASDFRGSLSELGFSYKWFRLNANLSKIEYDYRQIDNLKDDAESLKKGISATAWFLNSGISGNTDIKLGLTAGFDYISYENYQGFVPETNNELVFDIYNQDNRIQGSLGIDSYINVYLEKNWVLQPNLYFGYSLIKTNFSPISANVGKGKRDVNDNSTVTAIGFTFGKTFWEDLTFSISMKQYFFSQKEENYPWLAAGLAFPIGK